MTRTRRTAPHRTAPGHAAGGPGPRAAGGTAPRWRALAVWATGLAAYVVAVAGRTSLGVAGLEAAERFSVDASTLATFSVVQLSVYAAAQIPAGMILDRVGPRRLIASGAVVLAVGQLLLAVAETLGGALAARVLIGLGDAFTLISVLRLVAAWFPAREIPLFTQLTAIVGQLGQAVSALPFAALLRASGWEPAFLTLAGSGVVVAVLVAVTARDRPAGARPPGARSAGLVHGLRAVVREPGVWLGFFTHMVTLFPANAFLFLWGVPFLTVGQGLDGATAGALLTVTVLAGFVLGPLMGVLTGRFPGHRLGIVVAVVTASTVMWATVLGPQTPRPLWQLVLLMVAVAGGVAACAIGFDLARTAVDGEHLGTATGFVNVGGYSASLLGILLMGLVLDAVRPGGGYVLADFRLAFGSLSVLLAAGLLGLAVARRRARRRPDDGEPDRPRGGRSTIPSRARGEMPHTATTP